MERHHGDTILLAMPDLTRHETDEHACAVSLVPLERDHPARPSTGAWRVMRLQEGQVDTCDATEHGRQTKSII